MTKMMKSDKYYYSDATFQLEINLHKVRKELVTMLEFYEGIHCRNCSLLKCKCANTDKKSTNTSGTPSNNTSENKSSSNTEPNEEREKVQIKLKADTEDKEKGDKNYLSPAPSTPEKKTDANDIESWMEASKKEDSVAEKMVRNSKNSLVTIESVRPADLPLKILQKSCVLNPSNVLNCSNVMNGLKSSNIVNNGSLETFFNLKSQKMTQSQLVYMSAVLATCDRSKQKYRYF